MNTTNITTGSSSVEPVTMSELLNLASWNRQRSNDELREFIARRENILANISE